MFCPRCAAENEGELSYCRQCGQSLSDVRLALEGRGAETLKGLRGGEKWMNGGIATLISFTSIAVSMTILGLVVHDPSLSTIAMINVLLGVLVGLPLMFVGKAAVKRATRLLSEHRAESLNPQQRKERLTTGLNQDLPGLPGPNSVTEETTLNLRNSNRASRQRGNVGRKQSQ